MARDEGTTLAFIFSLVGGILIIFGSILMLSVQLFASLWEALRYGVFTTGEWSSTMPWIGGRALPAEDVLAFFILGLIFGGATIIGAILLESRPLQRIRWGAVILAFSILSLVGTGIFVMGAILGIAGGVMAMTGLWEQGAT